jgi:NAD(P)-dependent dehydrogenase (short-subunit alcohol dehydrogenase family)
MGVLDGKVALITGGGSGLGRALVKRFVAEGAYVGIIELDPSRAEALMRDFGDTVVVTIGDVCVFEHNQAAVTRVVERFGRLDVFIGNAGVYDNRISFESLPGEKISSAFDELFAVNVKGYLLGAKAAIAELYKTRGCIIFTASISSLYPGYGGVLYVAAKHAVVGLTRQLALELAPRIRVNAVAPGYIPTNLRGLSSLGQGVSKTIVADLSEQMPLRIVPTADDYTGIYVLLASSEASNILTGTIILADGGLSMWPRQI